MRMFHDAILEASDKEDEVPKMKSHHKVETPHGTTI